MYFLYRFDSSSLSYNMPQAFRLEGVLDRDRLTGCFKSLIGRHESLRTSFLEVSGHAYQEVFSDVDFELELYGPSGSGLGDILTSFVRPFDLGQGPLLRAGLVEESPESHILVIDLHHIVTDGVSQGVLIKDFMAFYNDEPLPDLRLTYKDYSEWQQGAEQQERLKAQRGFWLEEFSDDITVLELPTDHPRPLVKGHSGDSVFFSLGTEETSALKSISKDSGSTMFMTVLALFNVLLGKLGNQEDITVGTPVAGRSHADLEGMVGMFVNTLALRNYPKGSMAFKEFLMEVKERSLSHFSNQEYQYEELIDELNIVRDTGRNPLFDVMFSYQNFEHEELDLPGLKLSPYDFDHRISKFDLLLNVIEFPDRLKLSIEYSTELFDEGTIGRFVTYFENIVGRVIEDPAVRLSDIAMITPEERDELLYGFNDTAVDYP
ncbi:condensation domain-containing protein, partial [Maribacter sp. 2307UL18-2]|uniref:condensation domain-containing protein n=1 Tax=Maribacter sp. 2307UL18-2 TaxID=3386274 RepID=UPI0039BCCFAA